MKTVGLSPSVRKEYGERVRQHRDSLVQGFYRVPMDYVFVRTNENPVEQLMSLLASRLRA